MQKVQAPVYGEPGVLSALPGALHLESGIVGESRLPAGNDPASFGDAFVLVFLFFRNCFQVSYFSARLDAIASITPVESFFCV